MHSFVKPNEFLFFKVNMRLSALLFFFFLTLLYFRRIIIFASRNVLCTKGVIPLYFQESEPDNYLAGLVQMPEQGGVVKGNAWLISFLFQSWMKCLTQLLAHTACLQERGINLTRCCSFPLLLCGQHCCTEDAGGGGEGGKRKGRKSQSELHKKGPVWEFNVRAEHKNGPWLGKWKLERRNPLIHEWFIRRGAEQSRLPSPVGWYMAILCVLLKASVFH